MIVAVKHSAMACFFCDVQTVFIGRILGVRLGSDGNDRRVPLIWINGRAANLAGRKYA